MFVLRLEISDASEHLITDPYCDVKGNEALYQP